MSTENPYADITLPGPPAGYRLAKWGEERDNSDRDVLMYDTDGGWLVFFGDLGGDLCYQEDYPLLSIFAIPLDQPSPPKSWQFREVPWVPKQPETLADVPGDVKCVCCRQSMWQVVWRDCRGRVYAVNEYGGCGPELSGTPDEYKLVRYLDPPPQKPLSLDDVPDGRCVMSGHPTDNKGYIWRSDGVWLRRYEDGTILHTVEPLTFTITNYIAEFK